MILPTPDCCANPRCGGLSFRPITHSGCALSEGVPGAVKVSPLGVIGWECATCLMRWSPARTGEDASKSNDA